MKHLDLSKYDHSYAEYSSIIDSWVFSERDRKVLKRRMLDGIGLEQLAEEFELSVTTIKNIVNKHEPIILKHI